LGDVTDLSHPPAQLLKLPAAPLRGWKVWPHARYFSGFNLTLPPQPPPRISTPKSN
jgi:hypothetical protein